GGGGRRGGGEAGGAGGGGGGAGGPVPADRRLGLAQGLVARPQRSRAAVEAAVAGGVVGVRGAGDAARVIRAVEPLPEVVVGVAVDDLSGQHAHLATGVEPIPDHRRAVAADPGAARPAAGRGAVVPGAGGELRASG